MIHWLRDSGQLGWILLGSTVAVLIGLRTRLVLAALLLGLFLVAVGVHVCSWDGQPHLTEKIDATIFFWGRAVELRAIVGCMALVLAVPLGHTAGKLAGCSRGAIGGIATLGSLGFGLLSSNLYIGVQMAAVGSADSPALRLELMRRAVTVSGYLLCGSAGVMVLASLVFARVLFYKRQRSLPAV